MLAAIDPNQSRAEEGQRQAQRYIVPTQIDGHKVLLREMKPQVRCSKSSPGRWPPQRSEIFANSETKQATSMVDNDLKSAFAKSVPLQNSVSQWSVGNDRN